MRGEIISRITSRYVERGSRIYMDGFPSYRILQSLGFSHEWVNHSEDEYTRRDVHVNNCENRASLLRPWLVVHRGVSKDNINVYLSLLYFQRTASQLSTLQKIKLIVKA